MKRQPGRVSERENESEEAKTIDFDAMRAGIGCALCCCACVCVPMHHHHNCACKNAREFFFRFMEGNKSVIHPRIVEEERAAREREGIVHCNMSVCECVM